jgi:hypothetical protein
MRICAGDDLTKTLRELFDMNVVRVPETRIEPLNAISGGSEKFIGPLESLLADQPPLDFKRGDVNTSQMANLSGKRTRKVKADVGLKVLDGFLSGFGVSSPEIEAKFKGSSEVSFSFQDVRRRWVDLGWLGHMLEGHRIDPASPIAQPFLGTSMLLVIDNVITSSDFSISVDRASSGKFKLDVDAIKKIVGDLSTEVSVSTSTGYDVSFKGSRHLGFAFSCVRFWLSEQGDIRVIAPDQEENLDHVLTVARIEPPQFSYSPDRVLLTRRPEFVEFAN